MATVFSQEASRQWAQRPPDQRYWNLQEAAVAAEKFQRSCAEKLSPLEDMRVIADTTRGEILIHNKSKPESNAVGLTHYAAGQLCRFVGAPASYITELPETLAAQNLNYGLARVAPRGVNSLLSHDDRRVHALTTDAYDRVWNSTVLSALVRSQHTHNGTWRAPPAWAKGQGAADPRARKATEADVMAASIVKVGDMITPSGIYVSDHDMFVYLVHDTLTVDDGTGHPLYIGQFVRNSEVGDGSLSGKMFLFDYTCGNHNVWGVKREFNWSLRHVKGRQVTQGNTFTNAFGWNGKHKATLNSVNDRNRLEMEELIRKARGYEIALSTAELSVEEATTKTVYEWSQKKGLGLSQAIIEGAYTKAERSPRYGAPNTVWGMVSGLTEMSQEVSNGMADKRTEIDVSAGKLLEMAL